MTEKVRVNFASDNAAPVAPEVIEALQEANQGPAMGYGNDSITEAMEEKLREVFACDLRAFPVATGTAANSLALSVLVPPYGAVYSHKLGHIELDECGAPEFYTGGAKIVLLDGENGKIQAGDLHSALENSGAGNVHHVQPSALSLTQLTECGTAYSPDEVSTLAAVAKKHDLNVHMDGARFANALVSLGCEPADITWRAGVDVLSFGATKNGAMAAEAVVFFNMEKAKEFEFRRKRGAHLFSKMRYLSAQLHGYLSETNWLDWADHANKMARRLADGISEIEGASLTYPVEANMIFAKLPAPSLKRLSESDVLFYPNGPAENREIRLVASWNTTEEDVDTVLETIR
ncbi:MAG: low specificity L-threonine aldolase [Proteobacteria bacterium]|nr:low specificity L-threonine aldolase [Pseudomonadota bacterium]